MLQAAMRTNLQRFKNFSGFAFYFLRKHFHPQIVFASVSAALKEYFTVLQKRKMAKYRVDYQMYRLSQMEKLISENNQHFFVTGQKLNDIR